MTSPEPRRDRYGRYVVNGRNGKDISYTRVTTFAKTLADTYNLNAWRCRMTALGLSRRQDLLARVAAARDDDKAAIDKLVGDAVEAAEASRGANTGTALHEFTERLDLGELDLARIPEPWHADVAAYAATMAAHGLTVLTEHVEAVCVIEPLGLAGTMDRIVRAPDGRLFVADVKTGGIEWGMGDIAIQMACYANASSLYDYGTETHQPMPDVDRTTAIVIHLPAGKGECTLHDVDIAAGWEAAQLAEQVRAWRKRKGLSVPRVAAADVSYQVPGQTLALPPPPTADWVHTPEAITLPRDDEPMIPPLEDEVMDDARARAVAAGVMPMAEVAAAMAKETAAAVAEAKALHPSAPPAYLADEAKYKAELARFVAFPIEAKQWVAQHWPAETPTFKAHNNGESLTAVGLSKISATLDNAEAKFCMPFPDDDTPATVPPQVLPERRTVEVSVPAEIAAAIDEGEPLPADELAAIKARISAFLAANPAERAAINQLTKDAHEAGVGFGLAGNPSRRRADIVTAVLALAERGADSLDDLARRAVEMVLSEAQQESIPTGALLGTLDKDEAAHLRAIAEANAFDRSTSAVVS